jgi:predicted HD superfamily hydrolase involved in NAD metabolism
MQAIDDMIVFLKKEVSERTFVHSVSTMETAVRIAERFGADVRKCAAAGLLHDCAKGITGSGAIRMCLRNGIRPDDIQKRHTVLLHGCLGRIIARDALGVDDEEILDAIGSHTMGRPAMSMVEKIIFLADYIEPHRSFTGVGKLRKITYEDPDKAVIYAIDGTIRDILSKGDLLHPGIIDTRNYYILKRGESDGAKKTGGKDRWSAER